MNKTEKIDQIALDMASASLEETAPKLGFTPDEDGIFSEKAAAAVLEHFRAWVISADICSDD